MFTLHNDFSVCHKYNYTTVKYSVINNVVRILVPFTRANKILNLIIDTGAQMSIVKLSALRKDAIICTSAKRPVKGITPGACTQTLGNITGNLMLNDIPFIHDFQIMKNIDLDISSDGLLGNDFLMNYGAILKLKENIMELRFPKFYWDESNDQVTELKKEDVSPKTAVRENKKSEKKEIEQEATITKWTIFLHSRLGKSPK